MEQRGNDRQLLLHAVGVGGHRLGQIVCQLKGVGQTPDALPPFPGADSEDISHKIQKLDACHELVQIGIVRDISQLRLAGERILLHGSAVHIDLAAVVLQNAAACLDGRGFARPVVADKAGDLSRADVQGQVVHRPLLPVDFCQVLDSQHSERSFSRLVQAEYTLHPLEGQVLFSPFL